MKFFSVEQTKNIGFLVLIIYVRIRRRTYVKTFDKCHRYFWNAPFSRMRMLVLIFFRLDLMDYNWKRKKNCPNMKFRILQMHDFLQWIFGPIFSESGKQYVSRQYRSQGRWNRAHYSSYYIQAIFLYPLFSSVGLFDSKSITKIPSIKLLSLLWVFCGVCFVSEV